MAARTPVEVHQQWAEKMNAGDLEGVMALYEPEAAMLAQPGQVVTGSKAIREVIQGFLALKPRFALAGQQVVHSGDVALLLTSWTMSGTGPDGAPVTLAGTTSDVVRRQSDGTWRFILDNPIGSAAVA